MHNSQKHGIVGVRISKLVKIFLYYMTSLLQTDDTSISTTHLLVDEYNTKNWDLNAKHELQFLILMIIILMQVVSVSNRVIFPLLTNVH